METRDGNRIASMKLFTTLTNSVLSIYANIFFLAFAIGAFEPSEYLPFLRHAWARLGKMQVYEKRKTKKKIGNQ